ncbi:hypothetical protein HUK84_19965, partial [Nguyenibacter vanlangensis]|nr:hypothetical protein [Nguyenibacter vanlangensis]
MSEIIAFRGNARKDDTLWAVIATAGPTRRIADIYPARPAALADCAWRAQQVRAYAHL